MSDCVEYKQISDIKNKDLWLQKGCGRDLDKNWRKSDYGN